MPRITIERDIDIVNAVQHCIGEARKAGFKRTKQFMIATATSELARNILVYAKKGTVSIDHISEGNREGLRVIAKDQGPGIVNIELALSDHYSTSKSLGIGLPGTKRLMDEFQIESEVGKGTEIIIKKWL